MGNWDMLRNQMNLKDPKMENIALIQMLKKIKKPVTGPEMMKF